MPLNLNDDKSTLVQVMAWCRQATSHYLSQCCPRSLSPYGVIRPQWVNPCHANSMSRNMIQCRSIWRQKAAIKPHYSFTYDKTSTTGTMRSFRSSICIWWFAISFINDKRSTMINYWLFNVSKFKTLSLNKNLHQRKKSNSAYHHSQQTRRDSAVLRSWPSLQRPLPPPWVH